MKFRKGIKSFINLRGEREPILPELNPVLRLLAARARAERRLRELDAQLGKALAPLLRAAESAGDVNRLASMANTLTQAGSFDAHYFYESIYRIKEAKKKKA